MQASNRSYLSLAPSVPRIKPSESSEEKINCCRNCCILWQNNSHFQHFVIVTRGCGDPDHEQESYQSLSSNQSVSAVMSISCSVKTCLLFSSSPRKTKSFVPRLCLQTNHFSSNDTSFLNTTFERVFEMLNNTVDALLVGQMLMNHQLNTLVSNQGPNQGPEPLQPSSTVQWSDQGGGLLVRSCQFIIS